MAVTVTSHGKVPPAWRSVNRIAGAVLALTLVSLFLHAEALTRQIGLVLFDDFDGIALDTSIWSSEAGPAASIEVLDGRARLDAGYNLFTLHPYPPEEFAPIRIEASIIVPLAGDTIRVYARSTREPVDVGVPSESLYCEVAGPDQVFRCRASGHPNCAPRLTENSAPIIITDDTQGTIVVIDDGTSLTGLWITGANDTVSVTLPCTDTFTENYLGVGGYPTAVFDKITITANILTAAPPPPPPPGFENCPFFCGPNGYPSGNSRSCKCLCHGWTVDKDGVGFELPRRDGGYSGPECQTGRFTHQSRFLLDDLFGETDRTAEITFAAEVRNRAEWSIPRRKRIEVTQAFIPETFFLHTSRLTNKELIIELGKPSTFSRRRRVLEVPRALGYVFGIPLDADEGDDDLAAEGDTGMKLSIQSMDPARNLTRVGKYELRQAGTSTQPELTVYARWDLPPAIDITSQFIRPVLVVSSVDRSIDGRIDVATKPNGQHLIQMDRAAFNGSKLYFSIVPTGTFTLTDTGLLATPLRYELNVHFQDAVQFTVNIFLLAFWFSLILFVTVFRFVFPNLFMRCKIAIIGSHEEKEQYQQKVARRERLQSLKKDQAIDESIVMVTSKKNWRDRYPNMSHFSDEQRLSSFLRSLKLCRGLPSAYLPEIGLPEPNTAKVTNVLKNLLSHSMNITRALLKKANANSTGFVEPVEYRRTRAVSDSDDDDWWLTSVVDGTAKGAKSMLQTLDFSLSSEDSGDDEFLEDFDYESSDSTDAERHWAHDPTAAAAAEAEKDDTPGANPDAARPDGVPELLRTPMRKKNHFGVLGRTMRGGGEANATFADMLHQYLVTFDKVMTAPSVEALQRLLKLAGQLRYQLKLSSRAIQKQLMIISHRNKALLELADHPPPEDDDPKYPYLIATRVSLAIETHAMNIMRVYYHSTRLKRLIWKGVLALCEIPSLREKGLSLLQKHSINVIELTDTLKGKAEPFLAAQLGMNIPSQEFLDNDLPEDYSVFLAEVACKVGRRAAAELADTVLCRHQGELDEIVTSQIRSLIKKLHEFHYRMSSENIGRLLDYVSSLESIGVNGETVEPSFLPFLERVLEDIKNNMFLNTKWYRIRPSLNRELVQDMETIRRRLVRLVKVFGERKDALIRAAKKPPLDHERNIAVLDGSINLLPLVTAANHIKRVMDKYMRVFARVVETNEPTSVQRTMLDNMDNLYSTFSTMCGDQALKSLGEEIYSVMLPRVSNPTHLVTSMAKGEEAVYVLPKFAKQHNTKDKPTVYSLFEEAWIKCVCSSPTLHQVNRELKLGLTLNPRVDLPKRQGKINPPQGLTIVYQMIAVLGLIVRAAFGFFSRAFLVLWDLAMMHQAFMVLPRFGIPVITQSELEVTFRAFLPNGPRGFYTRTQRLFANTMWRLDLFRYLERWNCGGIVLGLSPAFVIAGVTVIYMVIKGRLIFYATRHIIRAGTGRRQWFKCFINGLAHVFSAFCLAITQVVVVNLTGFIVSSGYTLSRSCGELDKAMLDFISLPFLGILIFAAACLTAPIVVGKHTRQPGPVVRKWAILHLLWRTWHALQRLLMAVFGIWSDRMLLSHEVIKNAMILDDDPNDPSNYHMLALSLSGRLASLFWLVFPLGMLLTKLQDAFNYPPLFTICKRPPDNPWLNEFPCIEKKEDGRLVGPTVASLIKGDKERRRRELKRNQLLRARKRRERLGLAIPDDASVSDGASLSSVELQDLEENESDHEKPYDSIGFSECEYSVSDEEDQELLEIAPKSNPDGADDNERLVQVDAYSRAQLDLQWGIFHRIPLVIASLTMYSGIIGLLLTASQSFLAMILLGLVIELFVLVEWGLVSNWDYIVNLGNEDPPKSHTYLVQKKRLLGNHIESHLHEHKPKGPAPSDVLDYRDYLDNFKDEL